MFGFDDYTTDPRSGRPQPHISWLGERIVTWTAWLSAMASLVGAVAYYLKWQKIDGPVQMALAALLFAFIAYWRRSMLERKLAKYRDAVSAYEAMLTKFAV